MTHDIIGVDIAKDWIDIHTLSSGQGKRLAASRSALARFAARVGDVLVVMEASGAAPALLVHWIWRPFAAGGLQDFQPTHPPPASAVSDPARR